MPHISAHSKVKTNFSLSLKTSNSVLKRLALSYKTSRDSAYSNAHRCIRMIDDAKDLVLLFSDDAYLYTQILDEAYSY